MNAVAMSPDGMPADKNLSTKQTAHFLGVGVSTLERWRTTGGDYPLFTKHPGKRGRVTYSLRDLTEWVSSRKRRSTSEYGRDNDKPGTRPA
jgi:predicted DNA-binding transcriptional regulator AlpA